MMGIAPATGVTANAAATAVSPPIQFRYRFRIPNPPFGGFARLDLFPMKKTASGEAVVKPWLLRGVWERKRNMAAFCLSQNQRSCPFLQAGFPAPASSAASAFPVSQWQLDAPRAVTAAGPRRYFTCFPFHLPKGELGQVRYAVVGVHYTVPLCKSQPVYPIDSPGAVIK